MFIDDVSIITTVYNESDNINQFLESYKRQIVHASELIIVDGGSSDGTGKLIDEFVRGNSSLNIRLIVDPTCSKLHSRGPIARGRNRAIGEAKSSIIAVTDAGCLLDDNWLKEITSPFTQDAKVDVVAGFYRTATDNDFQKKFAAVFIPTEERFLPSSRSIAFKKMCWERVGGYPEASYTAEDTIFDISLINAGFSFYWNRNAIVTWQFAKDKTELKKKLYQYGYDEGFNCLFIGRYAYRFLSIIFPPLMLVKFILESRQKKLNFNMLYFFYFSQCRGFFVGTFDRVRKGVLS